MRIRAFLLADAVAADAVGKGFIHGAGVSAINAASFPWTQPQLAIYVMLEREEEPYGVDHSLALRFVRPDGEPLGPEIGSNFRIEQGEFEGLPERVNFAATLNGLLFPEAGVYTVVLQLDGEELDRTHIYVRAVDVDAGRVN